MTVKPYNPDDYVRGNPVAFAYPQSIPLQVRGKPIEWPHAAHVGGLFKMSCSWDIDNIPTRYQNLLCYGNIPTNVDKHTTFTTKRGIIICGDCDKPKVYRTHWCVCCGDFFILDFIDTRFCSAYPKCWKCIDTYKWDYCPDHASPKFVDFAENGDTTILAPVGLNPREFTAEELENVFDFD